MKAPTKGRRALIYGGVAAAAAAGGLGWAWWREKKALEWAAQTGGVWDLRFAQPGGGELVMQSLRGRPLVLNFWATWCPPCVKEMPELDRFARQFAGAGGLVIGLAVDNPKAVRDFLQRAPVSYPIALAGLDGTDLSRALGNTGGALPFTAVFARNGALAHRRLGETSFAELERWSQSL